MRRRTIGGEMFKFIDFLTSERTFQWVKKVDTRTQELGRGKPNSQSHWHLPPSQYVVCLWWRMTTEIGGEWNWCMSWSSVTIFNSPSVHWRWSTITLVNWSRWDGGKTFLFLAWIIIYSVCCPHIVPPLPCPCAVALALPLKNKIIITQ